MRCIKGVRTVVTTPSPKLQCMLYATFWASTDRKTYMYAHSHMHAHSDIHFIWAHYIHTYSVYIHCTLYLFNLSQVSIWTCIIIVCMLWHNYTAPLRKGAYYRISPPSHFGVNFLLRFNVYSRLCAHRSSNGWFMRTELWIVYVRSISNLPNSHKTKPS